MWMEWRLFDLGALNLLRQLHHGKLPCRRGNADHMTSMTLYDFHILLPDGHQLWQTHGCVSSNKHFGGVMGPLRVKLCMIFDITRTDSHYVLLTSLKDYVSIMYIARPPTSST